MKPRNLDFLETNNPYTKDYSQISDSVDPEDNRSIIIVKNNENTQNENNLIHTNKFIELFPTLEYKKSFCERICCSKVTTLKKLRQIQNNNIEVRKKAIIINYLIENHSSLSEDVLQRGSITDLYLLASLYDKRNLHPFLNSNQEFIDRISNLVFYSFNIFENQFARNHNEGNQVERFFIQIRDFITDEIANANTNYTIENLREYLTRGNNNN